MALPNNMGMVLGTSTSITRVAIQLDAIRPSLNISAAATATVAASNTASYDARWQCKQAHKLRAPKHVLICYYFVQTTKDH